MNRTFKKLSRCNSTSTIEGTTKYNTKETSYRKDYVKPGFSNFNKYQISTACPVYSTRVGLYRRPMNQEQKMLCPECYNRNLINDHELKNKLNNCTRSQLQSSTTIDDNLREISQKIIQDKIRNRERLTKNVSNSMTKFKNNKIELLQIECENDNFFANTRDYNRERAKKKQVQTEMFVKKNMDQFFKKERPEITEYYDKCVGKGNENIIKSSSTNKYIDKDNYYQDVKYQMELDKKLKNQRKKLEIEQDKRIINGQIEKQNRQYQQRYLRSLNDYKKMGEENQKMINEKHEKEKQQRLQKIKEEDQILKNAELANKALLKEKERKREEMNKICNDNLKKYLIEQENKKKQDILDKEQDRKYKGFCPHGCDMMTCDMCKKVYPRRVMTPFIVRKRNLNY